MAEDLITVEDPRGADIRGLLSQHLEHMASLSPPENVFALDVEGLLDPAVTFCAYRRDGELLAVGALKHLAGRHGELKSMHTAQAARGTGIGRAMLTHLIGLARGRGYQRLSLETGSMDGFRAARSLYASAGFTECGPFGGYPASEHSTFMTLQLEPPGAAAR